MISKILVPTDGSELSNKAIRGAADVAKKLGAKIVGVTVVEPYSYTALAEYRPESFEEYGRRMDAVAKQRLEVILDTAKEAGVQVETRVASSFSPYEAIIDAAREARCDAIFMASHGRRGLNAVLLGSETMKVLTHSTIPVMVYR